MTIWVKQHLPMNPIRTAPTEIIHAMNSNKQIQNSRPKHMVFLIYQGPEEDNLFTNWDLEHMALQGLLRKEKVPSELTIRLEQVVTQKLQAVKNQHYELSASFRDQERRILSEIWEKYVPRGYSSELILTGNETDYYFVAPLSILFRMKKEKSR